MKGSSVIRYKAWRNMAGSRNMEGLHYHLNLTLSHAVVKQDLKGLHPTLKCQKSSVNVSGGTKWALGSCLQLGAY
jgi:hypothetical protein